MITLTNILASISNFLPHLLKCRSSDNFINIKFLTDGQTSFYEDTLYLGYNSIIKKINNIPEKTTLFLIKSQNIDYSKILSKEITLCEFPKNTDIFSLFNSINDMLSKKSELPSGSSLLFKALIESNNLDQIVNLSAKLINNPLIVIDSSYNVLAYSKSIPVEDYQWKQNIARGYLTYEYIAALNNLEGIKNEPETNEPFITLCVMSPIPRKFSRLILNGLFLGYYIAIESNSKFHETEASMYLLISNVIAKEVSVERNITMHNKNQTYEGLMVDILDSNFINRTTFYEGIRGSVFDVNIPFKAITVDLSTYKNFNSLNELFKKSIKESLPDAWSVYYKKHIVILMDGRATNQKNNLKQFEKFLINNNLRSGISDLFTDLYLLPKYYNQAISALHFSSILNDEDTIVLYDNYKFYDLIQNFDDNNKLLDYCCLAVKEIKHYDIEHNTNYFETLFQYLACNKSLAKTSKVLFIHKNTVTYRITKIKELFNLDFNDFYHNFELYYSCLIIRYNDI